MSIFPWDRFIYYRDLCLERNEDTMRIEYTKTERTTTKDDATTVRVDEVWAALHTYTRISAHELRDFLTGIPDDAQIKFQAKDGNRPNSGGFNVIAERTTVPVPSDD